MVRRCMKTLVLRVAGLRTKELSQKEQRKVREEMRRPQSRLGNCLHSYVSISKNDGAPKERSYFKDTKVEGVDVV